MIEIACEQRSPEWYAARRGIPTASEFGRIITPAKGQLSTQADDYINRLIDEIVRPDAERGWGGNRHTERGTELEPEARDWYAFQADAEVRQVGLCLSDDRQAGCSPDALVGSLGGGEIKAPDGPTHVGYLRARSLPEAYKAQVHGSMVITGRRWWDFLSWCPPYRPLLLRVEWDGYTDKVAQALAEFLARYAEAKAAVLEDEA